MSQPMEVPAGDRDVVTVLTEDHRTVENTFAELEENGQSPEQRRQLANLLVTTLVRHAVAEEAYVYPLVRTQLPDGERIAERELADHANVEETMRRLAETEATDPAFDQLLGTLAADVRRHIVDEETILFPQLRAACAPGDLAELGRWVTRAHEVAPAGAEHPVPELVAPGASFVDQLRAALSPDRM